VQIVLESEQDMALPELVRAVGELQAHTCSKGKERNPMAIRTINGWIPAARYGPRRMNVAITDQ
jgi:hypothetical protein